MKKILSILLGGLFFSFAVGAVVIQENDKIIGVVGPLIQFLGSNIQPENNVWVDNKGLSDVNLVESNCGVGDGTADFVDIDNTLSALASTTSGTWTAWIRPVDSTPLPQYVPIAFGDKNVESAIFSFIDSNGVFRVVAQLGGVIKWDIDTNAPPFTNNTRTHIGLVQDGISPILFINGEIPAQTFNPSPDKTFRFSQFPLFDNGRIGAVNYNSLGEALFFGGGISDVRFYTGALTSGQIMAIYTGTNITENLVSYYPLAEGTGATTYDVIAGVTGTLNGTIADMRNCVQDVKHYNLEFGFTLSGDIRLPALIDGTLDVIGNAITNPFGNFHNNAETKLQQNGFITGINNLDIDNFRYTSTGVANKKLFDDFTGSINNISWLKSGNTLQNIIINDDTPSIMKVTQPIQWIYGLGKYVDNYASRTELTDKKANPISSQYPPAFSTTYVKTTTFEPAQFFGFRSTDPSEPLVGAYFSNQWLSANNQETNNRFHIDLGFSKIIERVYYENSHNAGGGTNMGVRSFTFWGSNSGGAFADTVYGNDTDWTQITASVALFDEHIAENITDPKFFTVTNTTGYRYYAFKFPDNWGNGSLAGVRRIELQSDNTVDLVDSSCREGDGAVDFINIDNTLSTLSGTTSGTWTAWVRPTDATPSAYNILMSFGDTNGASYIECFMNITTGLLTCVTFDGAGKWSLNTNTSPFSDNTWTFISLVQDGVSPIIYIDGVAVPQTFTESTDKTYWFGDHTNLDNGRIGDVSFNTAGEDFHFEGSVSDVRFYTGALTSEQIMTIYTGTNITDDLVAYYPLAEGSGDTTYDVIAGITGTLNGTIADQRNCLQDVKHYNLQFGFTLSGDILLPALIDGSADVIGNTITNPAGPGRHNNAETKLQQDMVVPIIQALDTDNFRYNGATRNKKSFDDFTGTIANLSRITDGNILWNIKTLQP